MFFRKSKKKKLQMIMNEIKAESQGMKRMIDFIKDWGNLTKRKNMKLKLSDFQGVKNHLFTLPLVMITALSIINDSPILKKKYYKLKLDVEKEITRQVKQIQGGK